VSKPRKSETGDYQDGVKVVEAFREFRPDLARDQSSRARGGKLLRVEPSVHMRRRCRDILSRTWTNREWTEEI